MGERVWGKAEEEGQFYDCGEEGKWPAGKHTGPEKGFTPKDLARYVKASADLKKDV